MHTVKELNKPVEILPPSLTQHIVDDQPHLCFLCGGRGIGKNILQPSAETQEPEERGVVLAAD